MERLCPACGKRNRVPARHAVSRGKCGACGGVLPAPDKPVPIDSEATFRDLLAAAPVPILVDFWADWCGPCRAAAPELEKVAAASVGEALVVKVDTEQLPALAQAYNVRSIPNFVVLGRGKVLRQEAGLTNATVMLRWLAEARDGA